MNFADKLIVLMEITKTSNKVLANYLHVDPSMISQIRTGRRNVSVKSQHMRNMARYFSAHFEKESQLVELSEVMKIDRECLCVSEVGIEELIFGWMSSRQDTLLEIEAKRSTVRTSNNDAERLDVTICGCPLEERVELHIKFYEHLVAMEKPATLYTNSDELLEWFSENSEARDKMRMLMESIIQKGFSVVQIVHPIAKSELMVKEMELWLPLYISGQVQIVYYPRIQDGFFRRTDLVVPDEILYTSSSSKERNYFASMSQSKMQLTVATERMKDFLKVCKPASFFHNRSRDILNCFFYYHHADVARISICSTLGPDTIPYKVVMEYMKGSDAYVNHYRTMKKIFDDYDFVPRNPAQDICQLATIDEIFEGKVRLMMPGRARNEDLLYYTPELYVIHLKYIIHLLETNEDYHFYPYQSRLKDAVFMAYEENGILLTSTKECHEVIEIKAQNVANVLYEYAERQVQALPAKVKDRSNTLRILQKLVNEIEERLQKNGRKS